MHKCIRLSRCLAFVVQTESYLISLIVPTSSLWINGAMEQTSQTPPHWLTLISTQGLAVIASLKWDLSGIEFVLIHYSFVLHLTWAILPYFPSASFNRCQLYFFEMPVTIKVHFCHYRGIHGFEDFMYWSDCWMEKLLSYVKEPCFVASKTQYIRLTYSRNLWRKES